MAHLLKTALNLNTLGCLRHGLRVATEHRPQWSLYSETSGSPKMGRSGYSITQHKDTKFSATELARVNSVRLLDGNQ